MPGTERNDDGSIDNRAERKQAGALREQARKGGLRFEAYLPPSMAEWVLAQVEAGVFTDPAEAAFVAVQSFIDLEPHHDLRGELLRRIIQKSADDPRPGIPHEEFVARMKRLMTEPQPEPARWQKNR